MSLLGALSAVREVVVSKFFDGVTEKLVSSVIDVLASSKYLQFPTKTQIQEELQKLKEVLQEIRALLDDAEEKQLKDQSVKLWLSNLLNLAYDVDDIVDELQTEISRGDLMERRGRSNKKPRRFYDPVIAVMSNIDMMSKIKDVTARLKDLEPQKNQLQLRMIDSQKSNRIKERQQPTSQEIETHVYGRDKDKEDILKLVFKSDDEGNFVIPIVGMGGIGKTTLAQLVYNDDTVKNHFDLKAWVCVSDDFNITRITKAIFQAVTSQSCNDNDLNSLQENLKKKLSEKKFLIVLDDVWNENYHNWTILRSPFLARAPGSKIIVTTRSSAVSSAMGVSNPHSLEILSENDCLSVFAQHALGARDFGGHPNLKEVAEKIARKCKGLPLAAKILGGLLRTNVDYGAWKRILESKIWKPSDKGYEIIPALQLSYHHLPPHLKRCFAYCSVLPKDYEFEEKEIILLWRAEGFLQEATDKHSIEDLGRECFRDLVSRSFFQKANKDGSRFVMHDLINDLAQSVAGEICFRIEGDQKISKHARHVSYIAGRLDGIKKFKGINEAQQLRTFLPFCLSYIGERNFVTNDVLTDLLPNLKCLRVVSLRNYYITELPDFWKDLIHLRYLDFSHTAIRCLPESISTLYNLETLLLGHCRELKKLPSEMENLDNLCYLDLTGTFGLKDMLNNFGTLSDLQTLSLSNFVLREGKGSQLGELEGLSNLKGELYILGLKNVVETQDARKAKLHDKYGLDKLELEWSEGFENRTGEIEKEVLRLLEPSKKLKELGVRGYCGVRFAKWIGDSSFTNLLSLVLEDCPNCTSLPSIGQLPLLKKARIRGLHSVTSVGVEFFGKNASNAFPRLESLEFEKMPEWDNWNFCEVDEEATKFPRLRKLLVGDCPKLLGSIPDNLPSLELLRIWNCEKLVISIQSLPVLSNLDIHSCQKVVLGSLKGFGDDRSLNEVSFSEISEWLTSGSIKVKSLRIKDCKENNWGLLTQPMSIGELSIAGWSQLVSIGAEEEREELMQLKIPCNIQKLKIHSCESLKKLSTTLHYVTSLTVIRLWNCPQLVSLSKNSLPLNLKGLEIISCKSLQCLFEEGENVSINNACALEQLIIQDCPSLISLSKNNLPLNLKSLDISGCENLGCLFEEGENVSINNACALECLILNDCPSLISLSKNNLPLNLKIVGISGCENLRCLLEEGENVDISNASLHERLDLSNCPSLVSLSSRGGLPTRLKQLSLRNCSKLESIAQEIQDNSSLESIDIISCSNIKNLPQGLNKLSHLQSIHIFECSKLVSFPENGLPTSSIEKLTLEGCDELQALPYGICNLNSLQVLNITDCSSVTSFPEEGFPTNLRKLVIGGPNICKPLIERGLQRLTSLKLLSISNGFPDAKLFPQEDIGMVLPCSLTTLQIKNFPNLKILSSKGFQGLTSLEILYIDDCPKLKSLPEKDMLSSLLELCISNCPVLKKRCEKNKGPEWSKIAHVPSVEYNDTYNPWFIADHLLGT